MDLYKDETQVLEKERKQYITQITEFSNKITKARELLLNDGIDSEDYKIVKKDSEEKISRLEAKLTNLASSGSSTNIASLLHSALENLKNLDLLYLNADIKAKREIIGSMFPEKWSFDGSEHRTGKINDAAQLICRINSHCSIKKTR